jgi:lipopolysaccharide transport system permease protein
MAFAQNHFQEHAMNPHASHTASPKEMLFSLWRNRQLISNMVRREVVGRYSGSIMGLTWSLINPIVMLAVYTFVFGTVFKSRWSDGTGSKTEFAMLLFSGLLIFNLFADCINRAPTLITSNQNYVKKVVFPLEIYAFVLMGTALFHFSVGIIVWLGFYFTFFGVPPVTIIALPLIILPHLLITMGISWMLASLGVFLRDLAQVVTVVTAILMFMSPIFYPASAVGERFGRWLQFNPITHAVEYARNVMFWGRFPNVFEWLSLFGISLMVAIAGFAWFQKTRKGFADVL